MSGSVYETITEAILAQLEKGEIPWRMPWTTNGPPRNLISRRAYRGINSFLLGLKGFASPFWITEDALKRLGGRIKDGQAPSEAVLWSWRLVQHAKDDSDSGSDSPRWVPFFWSHFLYNTDQCEEIEVPGIRRNPFKHIARCEAIIQRMPAPPRICHGYPSACYQPTFDHVNMPSRELFESPEEYYCTLFHELVHATGHSSRLKRHKAFKEEFEEREHAYSKEELVAELGAAFLCARAKISASTMENSGAYIQAWMHRIREDKKLFFHASAQAQKAVDYIRGKPPATASMAKPEPEGGPEGSEEP